MRNAPHPNIFFSFLSSPMPISHNLGSWHLFDDSNKSVTPRRLQVDRKNINLEFRGVFSLPSASNILPPKKVCWIQKIHPTLSAVLWHIFFTEGTDKTNVSDFTEALNETLLGFKMITKHKDLWKQIHWFGCTPNFPGCYRGFVNLKKPNMSWWNHHKGTRGA